MPKIATATLEGISPYSPSRNHDSPRLGDGKEAHDEYKQRTWREHAHYDAKGQVFIPPVGFKSAVAEAAKYLSIPIPGKQRSLYTKHFLAGVLVIDPVYVGVHKDDLVCEKLFLSATGKKGAGGGTMVWKWFPRIDAWSADVEFNVYDDTITKPVFERVLAEAGRFIGVGRYRPQNGGYYGRWKVEKVEWRDI